ncbi:UNVERIFIED_ORG: Fe2+ transport system protein FeoA [Martelella mediterranea]
MSDITLGFASRSECRLQTRFKQQATGDAPARQPEARPFPLAAADEGVWLSVVALKPGDRFHKRLGELGIQPGTRLRIVCRSEGGPLVVALGGFGETRIALGAGMAAKISVAPSGDFCE